MPILWKLFQSIGVNGHTQCMLVLVVGEQPLQCSEHYSSSDPEVPMGLLGSLLPYNNDIQFTWQPW